MTGIVWAEDSETDRFLVQTALQEADPPVTVAFAEDGAHAVSEARRLQPQLVVLDLKMPRVDGLEALRRLRGDSATSKVPVILFSSSSQPAEMRTARALGAMAFVQKPIDYGGFQRAVLAIVRHAWAPKARAGAAAGPAAPVQAPAAQAP